MATRRTKRTARKAVKKLVKKGVVKKSAKKTVIRKAVKKSTTGTKRPSAKKAVKKVVRKASTKSKTSTSSKAKQSTSKKSNYSGKRQYKKSGLKKATKSFQGIQLSQEDQKTLNQAIKAAKVRGRKQDSLTPKQVDILNKLLAKPLSNSERWSSLGAIQNALSSLRQGKQVGKQQNRLDRQTQKQEDRLQSQIQLQQDRIQSQNTGTDFGANNALSAMDSLLAGAVNTQQQQLTGLRDRFAQENAQTIESVDRFQQSISALAPPPPAPSYAPEPFSDGGGDTGFDLSSLLSLFDTSFDAPEAPAAPTPPPAPSYAIQPNVTAPIVGFNTSQRNSNAATGLGIGGFMGG